jgi:Sulfatase
MSPLNARALIPGHNVALITIDTLRYDVAMAALARGATPTLAGLLPGGTWEPRHSPGSFTYAAHHAFFAGFLPTPVAPGLHPRLFAASFAGSETSTAHTYVFEAADLVTGLADAGYHTICIGGVGFFNKQTPLSRVLPDLFHESWWSPEMGVTSATSTASQVRLAVERIEGVAPGTPVFLFMNISACHQPNHHYLPRADCDSVESQGAALAYVDSQLPPLIAGLRARGPWLVIICSDHGTAYGEDGYRGHRLAHPVVWTVPFAQFVLPADRSTS